MQNRGVMEYQFDHEKMSKNTKGLENSHGQSSQGTIRSSKLGDRFKLDKIEPSSANFHAVKDKDVNNVLHKTQGSGNKQQAQRKADELVRYMSNLPSYLERGEKHQEKAFNVGVLEWGRLEKWQHNHKHLFRESSTFTPSSSNTSSSSTQGSSSHSSKVRTCTPGRLRTYHPAVESNRRGSHSKVFPHGTKPCEKDVKAHEVQAIPSNYVKVQHSILKTHQCFNKYTEISAEESKLKHPNRQSVSDRRPSESENQCVTSDSKGKLKVPDGDLQEEKKKLQVPNHNLPHQHHKGTLKTVVLLRPKDMQEIRKPAAAEESNVTRKNGMGFIEAMRRVSSEYPDSRGCESSSEKPHSFRFPCELDGISRPSNEQPTSTKTKDIKVAFEMKRSLVHPHGSSVSPVRCKTPEDKSNKGLGDPGDTPKSKVGRERALVHPRGNSVSPVRCRIPEDKWNKALGEPAETPKPKTGVEVDKKARSPSPFRRFSFSMGRIVKSSSSDDLASMAQSNHQTGKVGSLGSENSVTPDTSCEKSNPTRKSTASPLRRLLDPLLKPRVGNSDHPIASADGASVPVERNSNVSDRQGDAHALNSVKVKLDLRSCKEIGIEHPHGTVKHGSIMVQALLQVALKNGLPLFTFAVDNSSDILAATITRLSSGRKDRNNWIFTFFTIHEMKKKGASWLNYANKDRKQSYIPNVVGQMKVSDVPTPDMVGKQSADDSRIREFVLLGVNMRQADEKSSDLQANDELAAIILKLPKMEGDRRKQNMQKLSTVDSTDSSQRIGSHLNENDVEGGKFSAGSENLLGLTAILPGGEHGLPCKGRPSPLIERWKYGGSCDCGGWDLGCRLRVLTTETNISTQSGSDTPLSTKKIHLFSQEYASDTKPLVSLSPFKDGIYSVEFDSSLKLLQAFSMCIAILNGLKPVEFLEMSNSFRKKSTEEPNTWFSTDGAKHSYMDYEENLACFNSCPPGTPADRV